MSSDPIEKQCVKAVILVGSRDFGRCPLASRLPTALWPVAGKPVLERLLSHLADQGIKQAAVCSTGESQLLAGSIRTDDRLELEFLDDSLPVGTAGCIRMAASKTNNMLLVIFPASVVCPPDIDFLVNEHRKGGSDLTVFLNPCSEDDRATGQASGIYACETGLLEHVPEAGYYDIKEGLIPEMLLGRKNIHAAILPRHAGNFHDRQGYLHSVFNCLEAGKLNGEVKNSTNIGKKNVWVMEDARVDSEAKVFGSVVVMSGSTISSGAVVIGPSIIGENVTVGKNSVVTDSILWNDANVGSNCRVQRCVLDRRVSIPDNTEAEDKSIAYKPSGTFRSLIEHISLAAKLCSGKVLPQIDRIRDKLPQWTCFESGQVLMLLGALLVSITFIWNYGPGLADLFDLWQKSDEYSFGLLVPFLAVYILWSRRQDIVKCPIKPSLWWGLFTFAGAHIVRLLGLFLMYSSAERLSIVMSIAALVLLLFGWQLFRKVFTTLLFLCLMLPWPNIVQYYVGLHLQRYATSSAVFCLETIGYEIMREGNIIHIGDASVAVAEACNGLRMITAFFAISGLVALLVRRTWWEKLIILISSIPIALLCNTVRLAVTAVFFTLLEGEHWEKIFHDFGGYAMMPLALAAVVGELWLLTKLTTVPDTEKAIIVVRRD